MGRKRDRFLTHQSAGVNKHELVTARVVAGEPDGVRARVAAALERLGFHVIEDSPHVVAKRPATGWGRSGWDNDVRSNPATVTVRVRSDGAGASKATFTYVVDVPLLLDGDKRVIAREVDAVVALGAAPPAPRACAACGTPTPGDSARFCRACGAPLGDETNAEVAALRALAAANAGNTSLWLGTAVAGVSIVALAGLAVWFAILAGVGMKGLGFLTLLMTLVGLVGLVTLVLGGRRLRRLLREDTQGEGVAVVPELSAPEPLALPARPEALSVTEGTTDLLDRERAPGERSGWR
jgi:hypothetical protein